MEPLYPSLVFPDTDIFSYRKFPLLLFTVPLYFLQPVERDGTECGNDNDVFITGGLCQAHTPAPLQEDRQRFLRLIHDLENRQDDYAAQLASLTMAAMTTKKGETDGEKRHQIISSLLADGGGMGKGREQQVDLWQARLVLAIGEKLEKEREELDLELQLLDGQELEMFRSLKGERDTDEEDPFAELEQLAARLDSSRPRELNMRFKSWLTLMRAAAAPKVSLYLASSPEAADQLVNLFEKNRSRGPVPILELNLPDHIEASPRYVVKRVNDFHEDAAEVRQALNADLNRLVNTAPLSTETVEDLLPTSVDVLKQWSELVEAHFPASSHGRAALVFYLLPDCPVAKLLSLQTDSTGAQPHHGLYAVMKRRS